MAPYLQAWLGAFFFTQVVEVPIWAAALRRDRRVPADPEDRDPWTPGRWPIWMCVAVGFGASAITHPFVWFAFPRFARGGYVSMVVQAEAFAVIVEAVYTGLLGLRRPISWSLLANGSSALLGLLSRWLFGWP